jgi:DNA replicative helicase MCM subunit Mcm2 (Cdc46/Mcm family)
MNEYVTKAKVIEAIEKAVAPEIITIGDYETIGIFTRESIEQIVSNLPAADVAEVRHGRWERVLTASGIISRVRCSVCAETQPLTFESMPYCPTCGSRMSQENKHKVRCAKCGKIKEMVCTVDGKPWCEDCFDKAMGSGTKHETN